MNSMKKSKRKLYEGEVLKDYRELVNRYKSRYANNVAFLSLRPALCAGHLPRQREARFSSVPIVSQH